MPVKDTPKLPMLEANINQEIGILVGFVALFMISTIAFSVGWNIKNKRQALKEVERQRVLNENGWGLQGWHGSEKTEMNNVNGSPVVEHQEIVDLEDVQSVSVVNPG